jgi:hypothetical protein
MAVTASPDAMVVQELVNTRDLRRFVPRGQPYRDGSRDDLSSPGDLRTWLAERGLLTPGTTVGSSDHAHVLRLRATLRAALDPSREEATDDVAVFPAPVVVEIDPREGPRLAAPDTGVEHAVGEICAAALRTRLTGEWWRLRACAADDCRWVFFDTSKPGRGRFCSPDMCGNRVKTRAYRRRRTEGAAG